MVYVEVNLYRRKTVEAVKLDYSHMQKGERKNIKEEIIVVTKKERTTAGETDQGTLRDERRSKSHRCIYRYLQKGDRVEIYVDGDVSLYLMNLCNYRKYEADRPYYAYGGKVRGPFGYLKIPQTGSWYVVVEAGNRRSEYSISFI